MIAIGLPQCRRRLRQGQTSLGHGGFLRVGSYRFEYMCAPLCVIVQMAFASVIGGGCDQFGPEAHELAHFVGNAEHGHKPGKTLSARYDVVELSALALQCFDDIDEIT